jgi:aspartyl/asparaginyl beta-hydroxylase (cupin superfamily)
MTETLSAGPEVAAPSVSENEAEQRLARNRFDISAAVTKADHRFIAGDHRSAAAFYAFAAKCAAARGTPDQPTADQARRANLMRDWLGERFRHHIVSGLEAAGFPRDVWPLRFRAALAIMFGDRPRDPVYERFPQMPNVFFYPGLPNEDFADTSTFAWRPAFESRFRAMRTEAADLLAAAGDFSPYVEKIPERPQGDFHGLLENPSWSSLYLWTNGRPVEENVARCPATFEAVRDLVPSVQIDGRAPAVFYSLLKPGAHIPPHTGMLNVRYICHLPLIVPPNCYIRVGERTMQWQEGKVMAFDDTVEHEARNAGDQDRLVLIFEIWKPHVTEPERLHVRKMLEIVDAYR